MEQNKANLEDRKKQLEADFMKQDKDYKSVQAQISENQKLMAAIRESQLRIQGAYAEITAQLQALQLQALEKPVDQKPEEE